MILYVGRSTKHFFEVNEKTISNPIPGLVECWNEFKEIRKYLSQYSLINLILLRALNFRLNASFVCVGGIVLCRNALLSMILNKAVIIYFIQLN